MTCREHVYRRHLLRTFCPRCFEHFDKPESVRAHLRAEVPCHRRDRVPDTITDDQEKLLRERAKANCSEETKWQNMYSIIFPDEKVPSPYYESPSGSSAADEQSRLARLNELREHLRKELPKLVRQHLAEYVDKLFQEMQDKVNQKAGEIIREVETKIIRTFHYHEGHATAAGPDAAEPNPPSHCATGAGPGPELPVLEQVMDQLWEDQQYRELRSGLAQDFDLETFLADGQGLDYDGFGGDSAYYSLSSKGGQEPCAIGGADFGNELY
ncbi:uncharacterized protein THITE_2124637 [Thermothielavioides terrestris NRRL 8126]|uniref:C2H2-type domain-containing protein n=1 Tax=Thermothielavioides terrestris (strain ATCC 38088 / NRRL 8126) TaxID=578455 RepID=G2RG59_THETT|nr:uncharacterized protein THITE_2124637 [Thermothielavioides terrestris NRRL 8126]AEO71802.1 hypothetical protein THITE_2124637 [Thermothielavioides terrestris NRRL 8126]